MVDISVENLIVIVRNETRKPSTMSKNKPKQAASPGQEMGLALDDLVKRGARHVIGQAIEAELAELLASCAHVTTLHGKRAVVRNGYLPERDVLTGAGPIAVKVPKVRDRSGSGIKFNSTIVPPYIRKSKRVSAALPWLYLKGISTEDMGEALRVLLGDDARGLSANVVSRLKAQWADEHEAWNRRDLSRSRYVYWWADGIHTGLRSEHSDGQCLLVMIGVTPDGRKERVAIGDGYRESKESWKELLLDLKRRGLQAGPLLAVGDGAMGFWAAMEEMFPQTGHQRCWFHKRAMCPTRCRNRNTPAPRRICRRSGWRPLVTKRRGRLPSLWKPTGASTRKPWRNWRRTGAACWRFTISLRNTGSISAPPTRSNQRSPRCVTEPPVPATAYRVQPSSGWRSS